MTELKHRVKSGAFAAVGASAGIALFTLQAAHEDGQSIDAKKIAKLSLGLGCLSGLLWSLTPAASEKPDDVLEKTKEVSYPVLRMFVHQMISNKIMKAASSTPYATSRGVEPSKALRVISDTGFDDDPITDKEYERLYLEEVEDQARADQLSDPFDEGPVSIFDLIGR